MSLPGLPLPKTRIRTFPEDPDTIGIGIADREFLLARNDAVELALKILAASGVQLFDSPQTPAEAG